MADNIIKVNVTASKKQSVNITAGQVQNQISATADTSQYYSNLSKNWAIGEGLIQNEDYSAKYYANKAQTSADNAQAYVSAVEGAYQGVQEAANIAIEEVAETKAEAIESVTAIATTGVASIEDKTNASLQEITTKTTKEIANIDKEIKEGKEEIKELADLIKDNAEEIASRTSFAMFDTILKDHILTYEESKGLALQGTYVYKNAVAGSRYGYPDFYNKVVEEYQNSSNTKQWIKSNVNYVGSVKDNQGVLSEFSTSNYATLPNRFAPTASDTWEVVLKINRLSTNDGGLLGYNSSGLFNFNIVSSKLCLHLSTVTNSWNIGEITGQTTLSTNTDYWVKVAFDGSSYQIFLSTDGDLYTIEGTLTSSSVPVYPTTTMLGICNTFAHNGIIDLNESYININGERWWTGVNNLEYKKNPNGHFFYDISEKDKVDEYFNINSTAWFYGVDTENERVFLPYNNGFRQLIEKKKPTADDQTWFNLYSDGYCEQGGIISIGGNANTTVTFSKPFINTDYYADASIRHTTHGAAEYSGLGSTFTTTGMQIVNGVAGTYNFVWQAKGYVEKPQTQDKLLYICVGNTETVSSITDVIDVTTTENDTTPLFTGMYFDFKPNNVSWLKGGQQKNNEGIYRTCYNELVNELTSPKYNLKVINEADMITGIDYSEYWKVNQDEMTFTTPTAINNKALSGAVAGNGLALGLTNGTVNAGLGATSSTYDRLYARENNFGANVSTSISTSSTVLTGTIGITTDATKSGIEAEQSTAQLYFKVANAVQNLELLDAGKVMEAVADKISRQDCKAYITETYVNGTSWYRVYSDGWCEQGGVVNSNSDSAYTVTLLKPYINTNYEVFITRKTTGDHSNNISGRWQEVYNLTITSFTTWGKYSAYPEAFWRASGYIA